MGPLCCNTALRLPHAANTTTNVALSVHSGGFSQTRGHASCVPSFLVLRLPSEASKRSIWCYVFCRFPFSVFGCRCDAVWEVCLENGRHKVTLRSALEVVNRCGSRLEVRCSTDAFATAGRDRGTRKEEVVGVVSLGQRCCCCCLVVAVVVAVVVVPVAVLVAVVNAVEVAEVVVVEVVVVVRVGVGSCLWLLLLLLLLLLIFLCVVAVVAVAVAVVGSSLLELRPYAFIQTTWDQWAMVYSVIIGSRMVTAGMLGCWEQQGWGREEGLEKLPELC